MSDTTIDDFRNARVNLEKELAIILTDFVNKNGKDINDIEIYISVFKRRFGVFSDPYINVRVNLNL